MRFLDTNIILRYLAKPITSADKTKHQSTTELFKSIKQGNEEVITDSSVVSEVVYVLCSTRQYNLSHEKAAARLRPIIHLRHLKLFHKRTYLRALDFFSMHNFLDFEDAVIIAQMERQGVKEIYSYDTDFDHMRDIKRIEPRSNHFRY